MECSKCIQEVDSDCKYLECTFCSGTYHFTCLNNVTDNEYEFLKSISNWKCDVCKNIKKGDNTPLTPGGSHRGVPSFKEVESGSDSSSASAANVTGKAVCAVCFKGFSRNGHRARCVKCTRVFHFKSECLSINKENYFKIQSTWVCHVCEGTEVDNGDPKLSVDKTLFAEIKQIAGLDSLALSGGDKTGGEVTLIAIMNEMKAFRAEVHKTNQNVEDNMNKYSEWVVDQGKKIDGVTKRLAGLCSDMTEFRQENINLKKKVSDLTLKVDSLEQEARGNVIEIYGVPVVLQENVLSIVGDIAAAVGFDFNTNMIDNCYRYKTKEKQTAGGIFVKFVRRMDMQSFVAKRREKRNLNTRDIGMMSGKASPIYVNYSLTKEKRKLLNAAREIKTKKQYTFLWVNNGRIFMRKDPGGEKIVINSDNDLAKLQ